MSRVARALGVVALFSVGLSLGSTDARADDAACVQSAETGQTARRDGHLIAAHDALLVCAAQTCPAEVRTDCVRWLAEVDHAIPSFSIALRDATGHDVTSAAVIIDGARRQETIGSASVPLDPGTHHLRVEPADKTHAPLETDVLLREGEKDRIVTLTLPPDPTVAPPPTPSRVTPLVIVTSAITLLAAASSTYFGVKAVSDHKSLESSCPHCSRSDISTAKTAAALCDISLGVTAVGAGITAWLLLRPVAAPDRTVGGASLDLVGRF